MMLSSIVDQVALRRDIAARYDIHHARQRPRDRVNKEVVHGSYSPEVLIHAAKHDQARTSFLYMRSL